MKRKLCNKIKGITLMSLVVTIIVLLILAGVTISLVTDGGIIERAKEAVKVTKLAEVKEQIKIEILAAQMEGISTGDGLSEDKIKEIVDKYGELQDDGDTIKTENGDLSLKDILNGNGDVSGGNKDEQIAELEKTVGELKGTIEDLNKQLEDEKIKKEELENRITDLNNQVDSLNKEVEDGKVTIEEKQGEIDTLNTEIASKNEELDNKNETINELEGAVNNLNGQIGNLNTQIAELTKKQATGNATEAQVLTGRTFSNSSGIGLTGTMPNRGTLNWSGNNTYYTVPEGYYSGGMIDSRPSYNNGYNDGVNSMKMPSSSGILYSSPLSEGASYAIYTFLRAKTVTLTYTITSYNASVSYARPQIDNDKSKVKLTYDGNQHTIVFDLNGSEWCSINAGSVINGYSCIEYNISPNY